MLTWKWLRVHPHAYPVTMCLDVSKWLLVGGCSVQPYVHMNKCATVALPWPQDSSGGP